MRHVSFFFCLALAGCASPPAERPDPPPTSTVDVVELGVADARDRMVAGTLTARALTQAYLDRVAALDDAGPMLNAVIEINPNALVDADRLDAERARGQVRGALHGIPVLIKDNIDVAGLVNSAGSLALASHRPARDAFLIDRLRAAGAVILGKTNLSEWANIRSTRSTSGWSSRGGQTRNPYVLDRNPCGSSSGTGAAIAASLGAVGVGTETDGSILCPAAVTGLVGLKPTVGLVSRSGIIPISASQDTAGPMGRTVRDAALLLAGMTGVDPTDPKSADSAGRMSDDYTSFLKPDALMGRRFGILRQAMGYHPDVDASVERMAKVLRSAGAIVVDVRVATYGEWNTPEMDVLMYEFKDGVNRYLETSGAPVRSLEALIAWNKEHAEAVMPHFGQELFEQAQARGPLTDTEYVKARDAARRLAGAQGIIATLDDNSLDAIIAPTGSPAWPTDYVLGDHFVGAGYGMAAVAGTPSITVPVGDVRGLPIGLTFMGRAFSEGELLGYAFALEQLTKSRRPPAFEGTLPAR